MSLCLGADLTQISKSYKLSPYSSYQFIQLLMISQLYMGMHQPKTEWYGILWTIWSRSLCVLQILLFRLQSSILTDSHTWIVKEIRHNYHAFWFLYCMVVYLSQTILPVDEMMNKNRLIHIREFIKLICKKMLHYRIERKGTSTIKI